MKHTLKLNLNSWGFHFPSSRREFSIETSNSRKFVPKPMSQFICKTILLERCSAGNLSKSITLCGLRMRWFSASSEDSQKHSFVVSYLIDSLGFSPKDALLASKRVNFQFSEKPDKTIEFLKGHGFTETQISNLVRIFPKILMYDTDRVILPKLEFLKAKGISMPEIAKKLSSYPSFLRYSLDNQIIPSYDFFKKFLVTDCRIIMVVKKHPNILTYNVENCVSPNVDTLRQHGVSDSNIATLIHHWPRILAANSERFRLSVEEATKMGFSPTKPMMFFPAVCAIVQRTSKSKWEAKARVYKKWGWSEKDISEAFLRSPWLMLMSIEKIEEAMGFFIAKMGFRPSQLAKFPRVFMHSLRKRVVPRVLFYQDLVSRDLLKKKVDLPTVVRPTEKQFLQRFITPYLSEVPDLLESYKEKLNLSSRQLGCDKK